MDTVTNLDKLESITSLQSTVSKLENACSRMTQKGVNTSLVKKRLKAVRIGLAMLENAWEQKTNNYVKDEIAEARNVLLGLLPSIESSYARSKDGSPQNTLLKRRLKALELAIDVMDDLQN